MLLIMKLIFLNQKDMKNLLDLLFKKEIVLNNF